MKNLLKLCFFAIVLFTVSCSDSDELMNETINDSQNVDLSSKASDASVVVFERPEGPGTDFLEVSGASSTLHRSKNGITVNFKTNGLMPNNAYTVWFVVFDNPGTPPGPPTLITYATGHIAGGSGNGNFSAHLNTNEDFTNPLTAEVHVVIRSHGQAAPGMVPDQIHTEMGGCKPELTFHQGPEGVWPDSDEMGYCANIQVAMHPKIEL